MVFQTVQPRKDEGCGMRERFVTGTGRFGRENGLPKEKRSVVKMNQYVVAVLGGGFCWGFMGFFTRHLTGFGIGAGDAIIVRCGVAAVCFAALLLGTDPRQFRVKIKDLWCFLGSGLLSLLFFTFCYFNAINLMNLSAAAILLYIAPTVVMLLSAVLFREKITKCKVLAVLFAFAGCCLVSGITGGVSITCRGLLFGLGAGVGYALYTIFSRYALQRGYSSGTINCYSCLLAALGAIALWGSGETWHAAAASPASVLWCLGTGVFSCFVPYLLYTYGLTGLENSRASVIASIEPVVASAVGVCFYHEKMTVSSLIGVLLVLFAVLLLNVRQKART